MGIRNAWIGRVIIQGIRHSLPPMGIRNPTRPTMSCDADGCGLITPHGDQERLKRTVLGEPGPNSLPPMGIRNAYLSSGSASGKAGTHYPPWGSGTRFRVTNSFGFKGDSLPPMGIRNAGLLVHVPVRRADSLPPMGIRNALGVLFDGVEVQRLITPHGDQEPPCGGRHVARDIQLLITPHGDQEPVVGFHAGHGVDRFSLPPMGIRNSGGAVRQPGELITPHGDQEPGGAGRR